MRELVVAIANTKNVRVESNYCNFKKNKRKIVAKQTRLQNLII